MRWRAIVQLSLGIAIVLVATLSPAPAPRAEAADTGYVLVNVADTSDVVPGIGGTYLGFAELTMNNNAEVAFWSTNGIDQGVFADEGPGVGRLVALAGDAAPGSGGGTFGPHFKPNINDAGDVAFKVDVTGGEGIFLASQSGLTALVRTGDASPEPAPYAGAFTAIGGPAAINSAGQVLFGANVGNFYPNYYSGLYVVSSGGISTVTSGLNAVLETGKESLADDGTATFFTGASYYFLDTIKVGPPVSTVAQVGDAAPGTGGGTYSAFPSAYSPFGPIINNSHDVAFSATVSGGTADYGIFLRSGAVITPIVVEGDGAPGGGTFSWQPPSGVSAPISLNNNGEAAFMANVAGGAGGIFTSCGGTIKRVVRFAGDPAPDTGGGTLSVDPPVINDSCEVSFTANVSGGNVSKGIFLALPSKGDSDSDGCGNARELQSEVGSQTSGGRRDPTNPYDYFNPSGDLKNRVDDILKVVHQFFIDSGNPAYSPDTDRTYVGPNAWNLGPPDGQQRVDDILHSVHQFFHDCI